MGGALQAIARSSPARGARMKRRREMKKGNKGVRSRGERKNVLGLKGAGGDERD